MELTMLGLVTFQLLGILPCIYFVDKLENSSPFSLRNMTWTGLLVCILFLPTFIFAVIIIRLGEWIFEVCEFLDKPVFKQEGKKDD